MANNETKITIKADNKQFLKAIKECTEKIKDFTSAAGKIEFKADNSEAKGKIEEVGRLLQTLKSSVIKISADNSGAKMVIEEIALGLQSLKAKPIQIDADISGAKVKLTELAGQLQEMKSSTLTVNLTGADSGNIKLELDSAQVNSSIAEIKSALEGIVAPEIRLDVDVSQAKESIEALSSQLNAPKADGIKIEVDADQGKKELEDLEKSLNGLEAAHVKVNLDATDAIRDLGVIDTRLRGLLQDANAHVNVDSAEALQDVEALLRELKKIQSKNVRIDLNANVTEAEIERINTLLIKLKSRSIDVRIDTADAAERLRELRSMAVEVRQALSKIRIPDLNASGVTALGAALQRLEKQAQETQRRLAQVHAPSGSGGNVSAAAGGIIGGGGILGALSKVTAAGASAVAVLGEVKDAAGAVVMPGFNFTKDMETAKLGIAGVLSSMATMNGEAIDFNDALGMSGDIFTKLQKDAVKTSATTAELVETFRAVLAPGLNAGMGIDEIQKFTTVGVNAVKSMGLPKDQIVQELGDLISGDISIDSTVAKNLGLKKEDIDNAKNSAEGLFAFLEARMSGLAQAAGKFPDTLAGKLSALDEASTMASAKLTEAFEPEIKALLGMITGFIADINTQTGELEVNPKILDVIESLKGGLDTVLSLFGEINSETGNFEFNEGTQDFIDGLGEGLKEVWELVESLFYSLDQLLNNDSFSYIDHWLAVLGDLWDILTDIISIIGDAITVIGNLGGKVLEVTGPFQKEFANAMRWAVEQLKEFIDMAKIGWEWLAKWSGGGAKDQPTKKKSWAGFKREEDTNTKNPVTSTGNVKAKYANSGETAAKAAEKAEKERITLANKAYKEMVARWKIDLDRVVRAVEDRLELNQAKYDQGYIGADQYYLTKVAAELTKAEADLKDLQRRLEGQKNLPVDPKDEGDKQIKIDELQLKIDQKEAEINKQNRAFDDIARAVEKANQVSSVKGLAPDISGQMEPYVKALGEYGQAILEASHAFGVDPRLVRAIAQVESNENPQAVSDVGALGIMQIMPGTAEDLGYSADQMKDASTNIWAVTKYLAQLLQEFGGDPLLAAAAYNAGPQAVKNYGGTPPYAETQNYVRKVDGQYNDNIRALPEDLRATLFPQLQSAVKEGLLNAGNQVMPTLRDVGKTAVETARALIAEKDADGNPLHMYGNTTDNPNNFVCTQFVVKSWDGLGLEDALHKAGVNTKDGEGNDMRDWVPAMMKVADKLGAWVDGNSDYQPKAGDAIVVNGDDHVVMATGQGNGYVASSEKGRPIAEYGDFRSAFAGKITGYVRLDKMAEAAKIKSPQSEAARRLEDPGFMQDKDSAAWKTAHKNETSKALEIMKNFYEGLGDISSTQLAKLEAETKETIRLLEAQKMPEVAEMARQVLEREKRKLNYSQLQKDLEYAQDELVDTQEELYYDLESGAKDSTQITEEYLAQCKTLFSGKLAELQAQLDDAISKGDKDLARDIKNKIKDVINTIGDGIKAILDKIDSEANREIEKIQMNKGMTNMQKDDAIDAVRRGANEKKVLSLEEKINIWEAIRENVNQDDTQQADFQKKHNGLTIDQAILDAEEELEYLNYQIEQTPTLLDKVNIAGKQAFEDGLLDFFTQGINECNSLGEAFRNLAVTVLEAIQRMYAEALVKNIMGALFPSDGVSIPGSGKQRPAGVQGPLRPDGSFAEGGPVVGPGTGTSDSIFAALSNGEFVINAAAVKQVGLNALHRINSGRAFDIPMPRFAAGGLVGEGGAQNGISQFAADTMANSMDKFSANVGVNASPTINNITDVRIDGGQLAGAFRGMIKADVNTHIEKYITSKAKFIAKTLGLVGWR